MSTDSHIVREASPSYGSLQTSRAVFTPRFDRFNDPARIAVLQGRFYSEAQLLDAQSALAFIQQNGITGVEGYTWETVREMRDAVAATRLIDALNRGRKWARVRLSERLSPLLEEDINIAVVPAHSPWMTDSPIRRLAQDLAATGTERTDATACLTRHTKISRIVFGGPSTRAVHRGSIRVEQPELVAGRRVLLLDDIARSGNSLRACQEMLYGHGAALVQMAALGRVIGDG